MKLTEVSLTILAGLLPECEPDMAIPVSCAGPDFAILNGDWFDAATPDDAGNAYVLFAIRWDGERLVHAELGSSRYQDRCDSLAIQRYTPPTEAGICFFTTIGNDT